MNEKLAKEILIRTKKNIFNNKVGNNTSLFLGNGIDFQEIREYHYGDDVRKINWNVTAKNNGEPYLNLYNEDRELNICIIYLLNGNIEYGINKKKKEIMTEIMSLLSLSTIDKGDNLTTLFFSNKEEKLFPPTKKSGVVFETIKHSLNIDNLGTETNYKEMIEYINLKIKRKSIIFMIGDFYTNVDFKKLSNKHEYYSIIVRDKTEEDISLLGEKNIIDPISLNNSNILFNKKIQNQFKNEIIENDNILYENLIKNRINFKKIYTDDDIFLELKKIVNKKGR